MYYRVTQRRLLAVPEEYTVLVDYLDAPEEHIKDGKLICEAISENENNEDVD